MKKLAILAVLSAGLAITAIAQDATNAPPTAPRDPATPPPPPPADTTVKVERPAKPENRPTLPAEVQALVDKFQAAREAFLKEEQAAQKTLKDASADDRAKIRAELAAAKSDLIAQEKALHDQIKRVDVLKEKLPDLKRPVNAGAGPKTKPGSN